MSALSIRHATQDDAEALFAIHRESALTAYVDIFPPDRYRFPDARMRAHWGQALRDGETDVLIAERAGTPVGFATVSPGWLRNLFVLPAEWGRGPGSALHDAAVELLRGHGRGARLWVLERNERARRFYEARGWRDDGGRTRSAFPPHPVELRYTLELWAARGPSLTPTHPKGTERRG
ncbi:MAG TPA: GNAT family N-acetyltransferase [Gaiellaceae bacterium]